MAGEVLVDGHDARVLEPRGKRARVLGDDLRIVAERTIADHLVGALVAHIGVGREVDRDTEPLELTADRRRKGAHLGGSLGLGQLARRRTVDTERRQSRHAATLLVDGHHQREGLRT